MKKTILLLTTALCATWVSAQITITNATFPAEGDTLKMAFDAAPPTIEITPPGGDQNWDFSDLKLSFDRTLIYRPASEGSVGYQVPNADLFADLGDDVQLDEAVGIGLAVGLALGGGADEDAGPGVVGAGEVDAALDQGLEREVPRR
ncbi:MAG: hypothetical protein AAB316_00615, partial [Bacteroidota bacterium]